MKALLKFLTGLSGAAMIAAGLFLASLPWIEIAQPPDSDAFRLIQFHSLLTGSLSIWALSTGKRDGVLTRFSLLLLGLNGWLAFLALTANDADLLWPAGFFAVSAINLAYLLATDTPAENDDKAPETTSKDGGEDEGLIPADFGVARAGGRAKSAVVMLGIMGPMIGAIIALIFFGAIYATLLKAAIFDGGAISFARVAENLREGAGDATLMNAGIAIVVTTVVYGFVFLIEAAITSLLDRKQKNAGIDVNRDLTRDERAYARDALFGLSEYLDGRGYGARWRSLYVTGVVALIASFIVVPMAVSLAESVADSYLEPARAISADPMYYSGATYIGGVVGGFFTGALLFWSLFQVLGARHPEFGEYLFARAGWNSLNNRPRTPGELLWVLARHIRMNALEIKKPFDPAAFLYAAFRERESFIYKSTAWSIALTVILVAADLGRFEVVDESGVAYSKYGQFTAQRVEFSLLDRVDLRCVLFRPNKQGNINLGVDYILVKEGEFRIDLLDAGAEDGDQLARIEALDAKLSALGIPMRRAKNAGLLQGRRSSFVATCAEEIGKRHDADIAPRLIRLLKVEHFADSPNAEKNDKTDWARGRR